MKKVMKTLAGFVLVVVILGIGAGGVFLYAGIRTADEVERHGSLETLVQQVQSDSQYVPYDQIAPFLLESTIAIEDARYREHGAVDIPSLLRAAASQIVPGMPKSGGSTIEMQVVKNLYHQFDGGIEWKAAEIILAHRLFERYSRDEILAIYVSIINYGDDNHGIGQAASNYYGVHPSQLDQGQASILAGIPQSPEYFGLRTNFDNARAKQKLVLDALIRQKVIDQGQAEAIYAQDCEPVAQWPAYAWAPAPAHHPSLLF